MEKNLRSSNRISASEVFEIANQNFGIRKQSYQSFEHLNLIDEPKQKIIIGKFLKNSYFDIFMGILTFLNFVMVYVD